MSNPEIKYLGDVQRLELKPSDTIVLTLPGRASLEMVERAHNLMTNAFPDRKVLILEDGMKIGVMGD